MITRKAIDGRATGIMVALCMIWGIQQVFLKAVGADMAPTMQIAVRSGASAILVGIMLYFQKNLIIFSDGLWRPGVLAGFCFSMEYLMVGEGLRHTTASHMVMFLYTAPIFAGLGLHWLLPDERLKPVQWLGIGLAFVGIVLTFYGRDPQTDEAAGSNTLLGDIFGLLAGAAWGATTIVVRCSALAMVSATRTVFYQLVTAFVILTLAAAIMGQTYFHSTPRLWGNLIFQTLVIAFFSFLAWFWLMRNYLASRLGVLSFMTPLFGITFGVIILDDPLETNFMIGSVLVMLGIVLVSGYDWLVSRKNRYHTLR